ncbi:MAG: aldolase [Bryobacterales bacterium]|nr:aldolase [Bryobacterales bacterium]
MKDNRFQRVIEEGRVPVGHMIMEFGTRGLAMMLKAADVDFVLYDMEHSGFDTCQVADLVAWLKATGIAPFVRVPQPLYHFIARTMDAGALGIMAANVESAAEAKRIVSAVKYAPLGGRGLGLGTAHNDYIAPDTAGYLKHANRNTTVICQIESTAGVENCEAIASTEGVDVLWVGHFDLSSSMGIPAEFHHPRFIDALRRVVAVAKAHGKAAGIQPGDERQAEEWLDMGFNVISWKTDISVYRGALEREIGWLRERLRGK